MTDTPTEPIGSNPLPAASSSESVDASSAHKAEHRRWTILTATAGVAFAGLIAIGHIVGGIAGFVEGYKVVAHALSRSGHDEVATLALPDKPSIAVLPFENLSGDKQEYFSDGMVEEIITALSRTRWLFVIARNSSFAYKGRAVDVKQVG